MKKLAFWLAGITFLVSFGLPVAAAADVNNFTISNFQSNQTLSRTDPQGTLHVIEHINVLFTDNNHGILRAIPNSYKNHSLQLHVNSVKSDSNAPNQYTTYSSNGNTVLKIGDPNRTVTGAQEYTIDYTLNNVITFYKDHDELYWDVNGDQWTQPFDKVSVALHLPSGLKLSLPPNCFVGSYGSKNQNCTVTTPDDKVLITTTTPLLANQTLTYTAAFEPGYFTPSTWNETAWEYHTQFLEFITPVIIIGGLGFVWWLRKGRDAKGTGVIIPQYDAPDNLSPLEVGTLVDFRADNSDITATLLDLAVRKYIKIIESKKNKRFAKDILDYELQLLNPDLSSLNTYETTLLNAIFSDKSSGQIVSLGDLKNKLYKTSESIRNEVQANMKTADYIRGKGLHINIWLLLRLAAIVIVILFGISKANTVWGVAGLVVGAVIFIGFMIHLSARTSKGVVALEHIRGLKLYLDVAEKDRIDLLQSPDAPYAPKSSGPKKTVELFEKLLPFAIVLGVEKQWAEQFVSIYTTPPDWYSGNWTTFNTVNMVSGFNTGLGQAVNTSFSSPASSSSSGFSGGGAGGGGGGGGGGGW